MKVAFASPNDEGLPDVRSAYEQLYGDFQENSHGSNALFDERRPEAHLRRRRPEEQLFQGNEFLDKLQGHTQYKVGEAARVVLHTGRNGGTTILPDGGGNLNTAGNQGINKADFNYKHMHQQIAIQEDVLEGTANDAIAVANALDTEVRAR
jgi:hypothetical protein